MPIGGMMAQDTQNAEMNRFIDNLMNKMTIEEKIGQLNMPNIDGDRKSTRLNSSHAR